LSCSDGKAIFGGRFDPIHLGHLEMAYIALSTGLVNHVVFVPTADPPHKHVSVSYEHRYKMVEIAIANIPEFSVERWEENERYTVNTWKRYANKRDWYLLGSDSFNTILYWYNYELLVKLVNFLIVPRLNIPVRRDILSVVNQYYIAEPCKVAVSSTDIRRWIKKGKRLGSIVPEGVLKYIEENGLYGSNNHRR